jgi:hypothetical protein
LRHLNNNLLDLGGGARPTGPAFPTAIVFLSDQPLVPPQQCRRRHDRGYFGQKLSPEAFGSDRQPTPLVVGKPQPSFTQLFAQNTVFLALVFDHLKLALIHPSGNSDQYKPEWIEDERHRVYCYIIQAPEDWPHNVYSTRSSFRAKRGSLCDFQNYGLPFLSKNLCAGKSCL